MDEPWLRLVVILLAAGVVAGFSLISKRRRVRASRRIESTGLAPGVYLLTAATCGECETARRLMGDVEGLVYREVTWEEDSEVFGRLEVADVPSTLIVASDASAHWYRGVPLAILESRNP